MPMDRPQESSGPSQPAEFWSRFWFNVCSYSEYYFMLLVFVTLLAILNAVAMLLAEQSRASFVIAVLVFVILGITGLGVAAVLFQCQRLSGPNTDRPHGESRNGSESRPAFRQESEADSQREED